MSLLAVAPLTLPEERFDALFAEHGPVETATMWGWAGLALLCLVILRPTTLASLSGAIVCLAAAAREADWHKSFTGYSVMKFGYYLDAERTLVARLLALSVMALVIATGVILARTLILRWREAEPRRSDWRVVAIVATGWLVATKVADRFRGVLRDLTGIEFREGPKDVLSAWEEGGELILPALFGAAVWVFVSSGGACRAGTAGDRDEG
jgi:energy-converting hydrogenase Eha subunit A